MNGVTWVLVFLAAFGVGLGVLVHNMPAISEAWLRRRARRALRRQPAEALLRELDARLALLAQKTAYSRANAGGVSRWGSGVGATAAGDEAFRLERYRGLLVAEARALGLLDVFE